MKISQVKEILEDPSMKNKNCNFKLTGKSRAPAWFMEFKLENDKRWEEQFKFNKMIINRLDNIVKKNNLKE